MHGPPRRNVQSHAKECIPQIDFPAPRVVHRSPRSLSARKKVCVPPRIRSVNLGSVRGEVYAGGCSSKWRKGTERSAGSHKISALTKKWSALQTKIESLLDRGLPVTVSGKFGR